MNILNSVAAVAVIVSCGMAAKKLVDISIKKKADAIKAAKINSACAAKGN